jgi:uncharacterized membrane protein YhaH (DUF805 family)
MFELLFSPMGRISRAQWWMVQLINTLVMMVAYFLIIGSLGRVNFKDPEVVLQLILGSAGTIGIAVLITFWFNLCATIKRHHDHGRSGLIVLVTFLPTALFFSGLFVFSIFASVIVSGWNLIQCGFLAGESHDNDYGPATGGGSWRKSGGFDEDHTGEIDDKYERAIAAALLSKNAPAQQATTQVYHPSPQQSQPANNRPVFGKRV